jgi:prephenate dehydrogenase/chorismate mutase/prephenate dehydrogenase
MPTLESIDEQLRTLLEQRVGLLSDAELTRTNPLPGHLWRAVEMHTRAAATSLEPREEGVAKTVTIIGGNGMMGRFLATRFRAFGHNVRTLDKDDWPDAPSLLIGADAAIIAVPIELTSGVIQAVARHLPTSATLSDITSTKSPYVEQMLDAHSGPVLSLHPMFGPGVDSFLSQRVIACRARCSDNSRWITDLIECDGGTVIDATPEEHDQMMISVQAIRHFATICFGRFMADDRMTARRALDFASPIYRIELDMVERLFAQDASLYADILLASPDRLLAVRRFAEMVEQTASLVTANDRDALIELFQQIAGALDAEPDRALDESSFLVESLCCYLAAQSS